MHADQLRLAVDQVVDSISVSGILSAIRDYRVAKGDQRQVAAALLEHAGGMLMERMEDVTPQQKTTLQALHLSSLREAAYWQDLLNPEKPEKARSAELLQLYSRVLFASNHLPSLVSLLGGVSNVSAGASGAGGQQMKSLEAGEARMTILLSDAGEKASDPDRIARSIDGIDMLYSASASLARRPAMDLRLDYISGDSDRLVGFTGESDSVSVMTEIIDSIPDALADLNDDQEIDLDELVHSLPIFEQLNTLAGHGAFSDNDLRDIRETMHQGALLTLESGVVLPETPQNGARPGSSAAQQSPSAAAGPGGARDEHYERYLEERAAMQNGSGVNGAIKPAADDPFPMLGKAVEVGTSPAAGDDGDAMDDIIKTLKRQRDG